MAKARWMLVGLLGAALAAFAVGPTAQGEPDVFVQVGNFFFQPDTIIVGDLNTPHRITFKNVAPDRAHHPIGDPHDPEHLDPGACFNAGAIFPEGLNARTEVTVTLPKPCGPFVTLHCHIHPELMMAKIVWPTWTPV